MSVSCLYGSRKSCRIRRTLSSKLFMTPLTMFATVASVGRSGYNSVCGQMNYLMWKKRAVKYIQGWPDDH